MKKILIFGIAGVVLITCVILFIVLGSKDSYYNIKILDSIGTVNVDRDNDTLDAYEGMKMRDKDYLRVASDGFTRIDCDKQTFVGSDLNIEEGMSVCECEYCCSKQTVPNLDDEEKS